MNSIWKEFRHNPIFWLIVFVPAVLGAEHAHAGSHTLLFFLSVAAIVPLAGILSRATESVAAKTGDAVGGLLSATCGNLTELVIAFTALQAGMDDLVRASIAGAVVSNSLFMLGGSFLLGGLRTRIQEFNPAAVRMQTGMLLFATVALLIPSAIVKVDRLNASAVHGHAQREPLGPPPRHLRARPPLLAQDAQRPVQERRPRRGARAALAAAVAPSRLAGSTVLVALVSHVFVGSVQGAAASLGMSKAFVGFIVVSLVGAAAEMATAFAAARKDRLDLSVGIALGSSAQIALFVAPVLVLLSYAVAPTPMDLTFRGAEVLLVLLTTLTLTTVVSTGRSTWYSASSCWPSTRSSR